MKKIFQRLPLGRGMDVLSYGYAFWINQCTNGFHGLEEPGDVTTLMMDEAHASRYLVHSRADKTYYDLRDMYGGHVWRRILLPMYAHYMVVREDFKMENLARLYTSEIVTRHEVHVSIISDRGGRFTLRLWSPVLWAKIGESSLIRLELVQETIEKVVLIKEKLKAARDRQKSYADNRRKSLELEVGDKVLLKVSPWKGVMRFGKKGKLAPRYVGLFEILERIGLVAYRLRFPNELSEVHDTFHVSNLKKYLADANLHVPLNEIEFEKTLHFVKKPVEIMDHEREDHMKARDLEAAFEYPGERYDDVEVNKVARETIRLHWKFPFDFVLYFVAWILE
ncbi:hypothetical protein Tco_0934768 [Tanacetum coccineum]